MWCKYLVQLDFNLLNWINFLTLSLDGDNIIILLNMALRWMVTLSSFYLFAPSVTDPYTVTTNIST